MVRIFTSFIFGVTIAPSLCSTSMQAMPRQPSSPASASPTGPPPTIRTGCFGTRTRISIEADVRHLGERLPFAQMGRDDGGKLVRRAGPRNRAELDDRVLHFGRA